MKHIRTSHFVASTLVGIFGLTVLFLPLTRVDDGLGLPHGSHFEPLGFRLMAAPIVGMLCLYLAGNLAKG